MRRATMARGYRAKQVSGFFRIGVPKGLSAFVVGTLSAATRGKAARAGSLDEGQKLYLAVSIMLRGLPYESPP